MCDTTIRKIITTVTDILARDGQFVWTPKAPKKFYYFKQKLSIHICLHHVHVHGGTILMDLGLKM